jgi:hypothetical protein
MSTEKTPAEIEREIEAERAGLARSLEELQAQFSPEAMVNTATTYMRSHGGDIASTIGRQIKANPMAAVLTGVGLAWLMLGSRNERDHHHYYEMDEGDADFRSAFSPDDPGFETRREPALAYDERVYPAAPGRLAEPQQEGFETRVERADEARTDRDEFTVNADHGLHDAQRSSSRSDRMKAKAYGARQRAYARSADLKARLSEGTESMSEAARIRVMRARQQAYEAQATMERRYGEYMASGRRSFEENPLLMGALAMGIGAAIGAALPRTEREDEAFGSYRDRAMEEADRVFREETAKLRAVAEAAVGEAKTMASEAMETADAKLKDAKSTAPTGKDAVDRAESVVTTAADRIASAARDEAEKQDLGSNLKT